MFLRATLYTAAVILVVVLPSSVGALANAWIEQTESLILLAISWNLAANAGLISLAHAAFWGLGAYASLLVTNRFGLPFLPSLLVATASGALVASALAVITGRLRGIFFAIASLALSEGLRVVSTMAPDITGGSVGVYLPRGLRPSLVTVEIATGLGAVAAVLIAHYVSRTRFHYACRAMRNNEHASQMLGINPFRFRLAVLTLTGALAGFAGGANIWFNGYTNPDTAFDLGITILAQIAPILGGIHTLAGPIIGAVATVGISEFTRMSLGAQGFSLAIYGLILVVSILYMPNGIYGVWRMVWKRRAHPAVPPAAAGARY